MPVDLLKYVSGPTPYSSWWPWIAALLILILIAMYLGIVLVTMPKRRLPLIGRTQDGLLRRRYARAVREIGNHYSAGELTSAAAAAALSRELRLFLHRATGQPSEYLQLHEFAAGDLAPAAAVLADVNDAQFNPASRVDVGAAATSAEELIRSWT